MATALKVLKETRPLWHNSNQTRMLGCTVCRNEPQCGGLNIATAAFSCRDLCTCNEPSTCKFVCPSRPASYVRYLREIGGSFDLSDVARAPTLPQPELPDFAPMIYGRACRSERLRAAWAAVPLAELFSRRSGETKFRTREELLRGFLLGDDTRLIVSGVDIDASIERYWGVARGSNFVASLTRLKPDLVTTPNFSLFVNAPREDNLHNIKRIAICWQELAAAGIPAALHVNARTDRDWERWAEFIGQRPEVSILAFEFATGAKYPDRGAWHVERLCHLREVVGRDLQLVVRGGRFLDTLRQSYERVTLVDTSIYVKSMRRQKLITVPGQERHWERTWTFIGEPLDRVMQQNLSAAGGTTMGG